MDRRSINDDAADAARWRALIGSERIRLLGSTHPPHSKPAPGAKYLAIEFWSESDLPGKVMALPVLLDYVDSIIKRKDNK